MVMRYLLDSNIIIFALKDPACIAANRLKATNTDDLAICSVVEGELYAGARKYGNPGRRKATLDEMLALYPSLPSTRLACRNRPASAIISNDKAAASVATIS